MAIVCRALIAVSLGICSAGGVLGFAAAPGAGRFAPALRSTAASGRSSASGLATLRLNSRRPRRGAVSMTAVTSGADIFQELGLKLVPRDQERLRFAPSPTGSLHVGGARTALYSYLVAKKSGGKFVLRIEDTDLARSTRESEDSMIRDLRWLGLDWDEGPYCGGPAGDYRQSERGETYVKIAKKLVEMGHAYPCFCTEEELEAKRQAAEASGSAVAYDGTWRDADPAEVKRRMDAGEPFTYRFKVPKGKVVSIDDLVRGRISWDVEATLGDFILLRSNGVPVYNFCVAVDDALMGITTVARAEEHLTNTVRQALVLEALGFPLPEYAHCSLILGEDKAKLSKRHGATSCDQFRQQVYALRVLSGMRACVEISLPLSVGLQFLFACLLSCGQEGKGSGSSEVLEACVHDTRSSVSVPLGHVFDGVFLLLLFGLFGLAFWLGLPSGLPAGRDDQLPCAAGLERRHGQGHLHSPRTNRLL